MTVTFFGHRETPQEIQVSLEKILINLIENGNATLFYVGNQGKFDSMVQKTLSDLMKKYSHIKYAVVLAYIPTKADEYTDYSNTIYPDGLEKTPRRFAICKRNEWMINQSDIVVTYIKHNLGNASQFKELSVKKGKTVINLADFN